MAQEILNNGDSNLVFRTKLNSNFTELYNASGKQFNWRGKFQLGNMYNTGDVVLGDDGNDYIAVSDGLVLAPPSSGWDEFVVVSDGKSAYDLWLDAGHSGSEQDFLDSLVGADGTDGVDGIDGKSAYDIWIDAGNTGSQSDFLSSLIGADGRSAYQVWLDAGNSGTEADFLNSLIGSGGGQQTALPWCAGYMKDRSIANNTSTDLEPVVEKGDSSLVSGTNFVVPAKGLYLFSVSCGVANVFTTSRNSWLHDATSDPARVAIAVFYTAYSMNVLDPLHAFFYAEAGERFVYGLRVSPAVSTIHANNVPPLFTFACIAAL